MKPSKKDRNELPDTKKENIDSLLKNINDLLPTKPMDALNLAQTFWEKQGKSETSNTRVKLLIILSKCYGTVGKYSEAYEHICLALKYKKGVRDEELGLIKETMSTILLNLNRFDEAIHNLKSAYKLYKKANNTLGMIKVFMLLGRGYNELFFYDLALDSLLKALELAKLQKDKLQLYSIYIGIGNVYSDAHELDKAVQFYSKSLAIAQKYGKPSHYADALSCLCKTYTLNNQFDLALKHAQIVLKIYEDNGQTEGLVKMLLNIGIILNNSGKPADALNYLQKSLDCIQSNDNPILYISISINIANSYYSLKQYKSAADTLEPAIRLGEKIKAIDLLLVAYHLYYEIARHQKQWKKALEYYQSHRDALDLVWNRDKETQFKQLENNFETIKKKQEAEIYKLKNIELKKHAKVISAQKEKLETALVELKQANDTKSKLLSIIAHDLRGPLGSLYQGLDLVMEIDFPKAEKMGFLLSLQKMAFRVYGLTDNLLRWASNQLNVIVNAPAPLPLKPIIDEMIEQHSVLLSAKQIKIVLEIHAEKPAWVDSSLFEVVFRNLLSNAIKFTPHNATIRIEIKQIKTYYQCKVIDSGQGIPDHVKELMFTTNKGVISDGTDNERGIGLGLLLCKEFVDMMGGEISVDSEIGKGSTFAFTFPVYLRKSKSPT